MKFGKTDNIRYKEIIARRTYLRDKEEKGWNVFAFFPVQLETGEYAWLEVVKKSRQHLRVDGFTSIIYDPISDWKYERLK